MFQRVKIFHKMVTDIFWDVGRLQAPRSYVGALIWARRESIQRKFIF